MNPFHDAAYNMAAVSATVALHRALIKKGVLAREEAVRILLDEVVAQAIQAEALHLLAYPLSRPGNSTLLGSLYVEL